MSRHTRQAQATNRRRREEARRLQAQRVAERTAAFEAQRQQAREAAIAENFNRTGRVLPDFLLSLRERKLQEEALAGRQEEQFTGPQLIENPFFEPTGPELVGPDTLGAALFGEDAQVPPNRAQEDNSGGIIRNVQAGAVTGRIRDDVNIDTARRLLREESISPARRERLEDLVTRAEESERAFRRDRARSAPERRAQFKARNEEFKTILRWATDPLNPKSQGEIDDVVARVNEKYNFLDSMASPTSLRKQNEEEDNPGLEVVNTAQALAEQFGVSEAYASSLLGLDSRTGKLDPATKQRAANILFQQSQPSTKEMAAIKTVQSRITRDLKRFDTNPLIFDQRTGERAKIIKPDGFFTPENAEVIEQQAAAIRQYEALLEERRTLDARQNSFIAPRNTQSPSVQPAGGNIAPPKTIRFQNTAEVPYQLQEGDDPSAIAQAAAEQAKATGQNVYVIHPVSKKRMTFRP